MELRDPEILELIRLWQSFPPEGEDECKLFYGLLFREAKRHCIRGRLARRSFIAELAQCQDAADLPSLRFADNDVSELAEILKTEDTRALKRWLAIIEFLHDVEGETELGMHEWKNMATKAQQDSLNRAKNALVAAEKKIGEDLPTYKLAIAGLIKKVSGEIEKTPKRKNTSRSKGDLNVNKLRVATDSIKSCWKAMTGQPFKWRYEFESWSEMDRDAAFDERNVSSFFYCEIAWRLNRYEPKNCNTALAAPILQTS